MINDKGIVLVGSSKDLLQICNSKYRAVSFFYKIGNDGLLNRLGLVPYHQKLFMGICDYNMSNNIKVNIKDLIKDILFEFGNHNFKGIVCDFDEICPVRVSLIHELDEILHRKNLPFFVPLKYAKYVSHAIILIQSNISGGSLSTFLYEQISSFGESRIALELGISCNKFAIPSYSPDGIVLSKNEFDNIISQHNPSIYFSSELSTKYFTYMEENNGYFVLFDDISTISQKIYLANKFNIQYKFIALEHIKSELGI